MNALPLPCKPRRCSRHSEAPRLFLHRSCREEEDWSTRVVSSPVSPARSSEPGEDPPQPGVLECYQHSPDERRNQGSREIMTRLNRPSQVGETGVSLSEQPFHLELSAADGFGHQELPFFFLFRCPLCLYIPNLGKMVVKRVSILC